MALGLCAVWVQDGLELERLTPQVAEIPFHKRLDFVEKAVFSRFSSESRAGSAYRAWIRRANAARLNRNELVHGRWGVEPASNRMVNVLGLPTSADQREVRYTIAALDQRLAEPRSLQADLYALRKQWPL
jgi:hypothetical protein